MWHVTYFDSGRIYTVYCEDKKSALVWAYTCLLGGADWIEIYYHEDGNFWMF